MFDKHILVIKMKKILAVCFIYLLTRGRADNVSLVFKENIRTILKPMTVLCGLHTMFIHIADTLSVPGIPYLNYKPNRFALNGQRGSPSLFFYFDTQVCTPKRA